MKTVDRKTWAAFVGKLPESVESKAVEAKTLGLAAMQYVGDDGKLLAQSIYKKMENLDGSSCIQVEYQIAD